MINGSPNFVLVQKLRNLKKDISNWNTEVFGKLDVKRDKALEELSMLDKAAENRPLSQPEKQKAVSLKVELMELAKAEEISWRQKLRGLWLKEGDRNTRFSKLLLAHTEGITALTNSDWTLV